MSALRLIRLPEVCERVGLSRATVYRLEKRKAFPARRHLTEVAVAWLEADVEAWINDRAIVEQAA